jgi:predicted HTH transcriptional regulator
MPKTKTTPPAKHAILEVLKVEPQASAAQIAVSASVGRSTASKLLAQLQSEGKVRRINGGHGEGNRRLPDLWSLADSQPAANDTKPSGTQTTGNKPDRKNTNGTPATSSPERLKPGELEGLILTYMQEHPDEPLGPGAVAKALQRSSGAVGNGLARLTHAKKVRQINDKPRRYQIAA